MDGAERDERGDRDEREAGEDAELRSDARVPGAGGDGPRTWWMPTWLSRRVPQISIDAEIRSLTPALEDR